MFVSYVSFMERNDHPKMHCSRVLFCLDLRFSKSNAQTLTLFENVPVRSVTVGGSKVLSGSDDNTVKIRDLSSGTLLQTLKVYKSYVFSEAESESL